MTNSFLSAFFVLTTIFVAVTFSFNIRKEEGDSYDFLLPIGEQSLAISADQIKHMSQQHLIDETKHRIANEIYKILRDASNHDNGMKDKRSEYEQKRQSLRKSNFDILAGGGLGK